MPQVSFAEKDVSCTKDLLGNVQCSTGGVSGKYKDANCTEDLLGNLECVNADRKRGSRGGEMNCTKDLLGNLECTSS